MKQRVGLLAVVLCLAAWQAACGSSGGGNVSPPPPSTSSTSDAKGQFGPYLYPPITYSNGSNTYVAQDVWNPIAGWVQTLYPTDPGNWYVTANMPSGNTAVISYPHTQQLYYQSLSNFTAIYSSFSENMNAAAATSAEAAYDIWLDNWKDEVMIWNDVSNRFACSTPAASIQFGGEHGVPLNTWNLCVLGSERIWELAGNGNVFGIHSGSVDILAMVNWLQNNAYMPLQPTLDDIEYGFEICSTGGVNEKFQVSSLSITSQ